MSLSRGTILISVSLSSLDLTLRCLTLFAPSSPVHRSCLYHLLVLAIHPHLLHPPTSPLCRYFVLCCKDPILVHASPRSVPVFTRQCPLRPHAFPLHPVDVTCPLRIHRMHRDQLMGVLSHLGWRSSVEWWDGPEVVRELGLGSLGILANAAVPLGLLRYACDHGHLDSMEFLSVQRVAVL